MTLPAITEEDFDQWKGHPVTIRLMAILKDVRESARDSWENGAFTDQSKHGSDIKNAQAIGACGIIRQLEELEFKDLFKEEKV